MTACGIGGGGCAPHDLPPAERVMLSGGLGGSGLATLGQLKPAFDVGIATRQIAVTAAGCVIFGVDALRHDRRLMPALLLGNATGKQQRQPHRPCKGRDAHVNHTLH